jgi:hypothetical protein
MASVIPKQLKKDRDQITIKLDRDVLQNLEHYCRYLQPRLRNQPVPRVHFSQGPDILGLVGRPRTHRLPSGEWKHCCRTRA